MDIEKFLYRMPVVLEVDVNESDSNGSNGDGGGVTALSSSKILRTTRQLKHNGPWSKAGKF